jgi:hypothetical protein
MSTKLFMVKCLNCGGDLKYQKTIDSEVGDGYYYEYNVEVCLKCKILHHTVIQYDLVIRDYMVIDQELGEEGK